LKQELLRRSSFHTPIESSFAKALKEDVGDLFDLTWKEIDEQKERQLTNDEHLAYAHLWFGPPGNTIREVLIDRAAGVRSRTLDHYVQHVMSHEYDRRRDMYITDWRYPNELEFIQRMGCQVVTIRVLRSGLPAPPLEDHSEHQLDGYPTDIIMTPMGDELLVPESYLQFKTSFYSTK